MFKIFKYPLDLKTGIVVMPENARIIRVDHVNDKFYNGDFVWAIVQVGDPSIEVNLHGTKWLKHKLVTDTYAIAPQKSYNPYHVERLPLGVKEKQSVDIIGHVVGAGEEDGRIFLEYYHDEAKHETLNLAFYKTGQEIDIPVEKLEYIGLCRLWIIQELGLYCFRIN